MSPKAPRRRPARGMQEQASGSNRQLPLYLIRIADVSRTLMELVEFERSGVSPGGP
jgi:hypothetical protein